MKITTEAKLVSAESNPYKFEGREGVSHKARFLIEGEIFVAKCTPEQVKDLQESIGKEGEVTLAFTSRKENIAIVFDSFEAE